MKAKFFFLGLCALALAACSIDEVSQVNDTNAIQFKATTTTRATATTTNNINEFTVWAWNGDNLFMDGVTASKSGSVFTTSPLYFWPTGSVDFYALTEVVEHGIFTDDSGSQHEYALLGGEISEGDDGLTYTGNVAKAQVDNGKIVIDACIPSTPEEQIDICYGVALEKSSSSVPMNFRHALSQVAFKAKNTNTAFDVKIADVSVCSVYSEGTYTIGKNDTSDNLATSDLGTSTITGSQGEWTITEKDATSEVPIKSRYLVNMENSIVQLDTEGTAVELVDPEGVLMLLPQKVVGWDPLTDAHDGNLGAYIRILCHVEESGSQLWPNSVEETYDGDDANFKTINGVEYAEIAIPLEDVEWEQGYRYTYTIIFGEGLGYYPPDDPNYELDGTPVLVPITFKVTVDEFQDAVAAEDGQFDVPTNVDLSEITVTTAAELVGAARMGYQVINVEKSITLENVYVEFTQDCTLNIADGVTITATNSTNGREYPSINGYNQYTAAIYVSGGTLTINGGTVATTGGEEAVNTEAIWVDGGTVIINSGTFKGGSWNADPNSVTGSESAVFVEYGAAYIYGGTYSSGKWNANGYYVLNCMDTPRKNGQAWIYVYGGTYYSFDPSNCNSEGAGTNFCADGYSTVYDKENDCYTVILTTVTTGVELQTALNAGASEITVSGTVTLNDGTSSYLTISNDCTIDIPEGSELLTSNIAGSVPGLYITGGTTTLTGSGTITYDEEAFPDPDSSQNYYTIWLSGGNVVIEGDLTFVGESHTVYAQKGFAYIYNGSFINNSPTSDGSYWVLNCQDANYKADPRLADIYCYGGRYYQFDPANNTSEGTGTSFVVSGYKSVYDADTDWYTVVKDE